MVIVNVCSRNRIVLLLVRNLLVIQTWVYSLGLVVLCCIYGLWCIQFRITDRNRDIRFEFMGHFDFFLLSVCRLSDYASTLLGQDAIFVTFGKRKFGSHVSWITLLSEDLHKGFFGRLKSILVSVRISFLH